MGGLADETEASTVDLFDISAVSPNGPVKEYEVSQAGDAVSSLVKLGDGGSPLGPMWPLSI